IKEFLLGAALAVEELDVVNQQQVERPVVTFEIVERLVLIRSHDIRDVSLGMDVSNPRAGVVLKDAVADGFDQMCLAKSDAPIDKEGVVRSRMLGDVPDGRAGELIRRALHEV